MTEHLFVCQRETFPKSKRVPSHKTTSLEFRLEGLDQWLYGLGEYLARLAPGLENGGGGMRWAVSSLFGGKRCRGGFPCGSGMPKPCRLGSRITVEREGRPLLRPKACFDRRAGEFMQDIPRAEATKQNLLGAHISQPCRNRHLTITFFYFTLCINARKFLRYMEISWDTKS